LDAVGGRYRLGLDWAFVVVESVGRLSGDLFRLRRYGPPSAARWWPQTFAAQSSARQTSRSTGGASRPRRLPACHTIFDVTGNLFTHGRQLKQLILDDRIVGLLGKLPIHGRLVPEIVRPIHAARTADTKTLREPQNELTILTDVTLDKISDRIRNVHTVDVAARLNLEGDIF